MEPGYTIYQISEYTRRYMWTDYHVSDLSKQKKTVITKVYFDWCCGVSIARFFFQNTLRRIPNSVFSSQKLQITHYFKKGFYTLLSILTLIFAISERKCSKIKLKNKDKNCIRFTQMWHQNIPITIGILQKLTQG